MANVTALPPQFIEQLRDQLEPHFEEAEMWTRGRYTGADLLDLCEEGRAMLFVAYEPDGENLIVTGVVVCFIQVYPRCRFLFVQYTGGDSSILWRQNMHDLLKRYAQDNDCVGFEWIGRTGLLRVMAENGAVPVGVMGEIRFELRGEQTT